MSGKKEKRVGQGKSPGRPKKVVVSEIDGICGAPTNPSFTVEMVYDNPKNLKKLFGIYRGYGISEVLMTFGEQTISIDSYSQSQESAIFTTFYGDVIERYYCATPGRSICVDCGWLSDTFKALGENECKISFVLSEERAGELLILVRDAQMETLQQFSAELLMSNNEFSSLKGRYDDSNFPVKYHVNSKDFKRVVNNIHHISKTFQIQKFPRRPLVINYDSPQRTSMNFVYENAEKIGLKCAFSEEDTFSVTLKVVQVRPFSATCIGDVTHIAADSYTYISFCTDGGTRKVKKRDPIGTGAAVSSQIAGFVLSDDEEDDDGSKKEDGTEMAAFTVKVYVHVETYASESGHK